VTGVEGPFHMTVSVALKFVPLMVRVNPPGPAVRKMGLKLVMAGGGLTVNASELEATRSEVMTLTFAVTGAATSVAGMRACACPFVTVGVVRFDPFHCTVTFDWKLPFTVRGN